MLAADVMWLMLLSLSEVVFETVVFEGAIKNNNLSVSIYIINRIRIKQKFFY